MIVVIAYCGHVRSAAAAAAAANNTRFHKITVALVADTAALVMGLVMMMRLIFAVGVRCWLLCAGRVTPTAARDGRLLETCDQAHGHGRLDHAAVLGRRELENGLNRLRFHDHREETLGEHARVGLDLWWLRVESECL